jgi:hypothetical protein
MEAAATATSIIAVMTVEAVNATQAAETVATEVVAEVDVQRGSERAIGGKRKEKGKDEH